MHTNITEGLCTHGFYVIDGFFEEETYQSLRSTVELFYQQGKFKPSKIGHQHQKNANLSIRNDAIFWLDKPSANEAISLYFKAMEALRDALNQSLFLGLIDVEAHFAVYPAHHFYKKHIDQFSNTKDRKISCVYYLNNEWSDENGGQLVLYDENNEPRPPILPLGNRLVCFNSDIAHEVLTAYQLRYSIASWLKIRPMTLIT